MFVITDKENVVIHTSETVEYNDNKDVLVDKATLTLPEPLVGLVKEVEENEIPEGVIGRYCYNEEEGFYKNPNYRIHYSEEERIQALEDAVNILLGF